jgi:hypothetical protein
MWAFKGRNAAINKPILGLFLNCSKNYQPLSSLPAVLKLIIIPAVTPQFKSPSDNAKVGPK